MPIVHTHRLLVTNCPLIQDATSQFIIEEFPDVLVICLKRFEFKVENSNDSLFTYFTWPQHCSYTEWHSVKGLFQNRHRGADLSAISTRCRERRRGEGAARTLCSVLCGYAPGDKRELRYGGTGILSQLDDALITIHALHRTLHDVFQAGSGHR